MHIKCLNRGTGSARSAQDYTLQEHDHKGELRESVEILRGNPELVTQLADCLDFKYRYTSMVIAWHKNDKPTREQVGEVLDDIERVAFSGLEGHQYCYYAVMHDNDHIHLIVPRVELTTGKSMNIAPPGHAKIYDLIRDKFNEKYGWARPDDMSRKRLVNNTLNIHADLRANEVRELINKTVTELVTVGKLQSRNDVITYLAQFGDITRESRKTISLKPEGLKKAIKLQGAVYEREFQLDRVIEEARTEQEERTSRDQGDRSKEVDRIESVIQKVVRDRAEFNRSRYGEASQQPQKEVVTDKARDLQRTERGLRGDKGRSPEPTPSSEPSKSKVLDNTTNNRFDTHDGTRDRPMGVGDSDHRPQPNAPSPEQPDKRSQKAERISRRRLHTDRENVRRRNRVKEEARSVADRQRDLGSPVQGVNDDTIRKRITAELKVTRRVVLQRAKEHIEGIRAEYQENQNLIREANERSIDGDRTARQNVGTVSEHINQLADQLRRSAGESLRRSSDEVGTSRGQFSEVIQSVSRWVGDLREKIIAKVKEIATKRDVSQSNSIWIKR